MLTCSPFLSAIPLRPPSGTASQTAHPFPLKRPPVLQHLSQKSPLLLWKDPFHFWTKPKGSGILNQIPSSSREFSSKPRNKTLQLLHPPSILRLLWQTFQSFQGRETCRYKLSSGTRLTPGWKCPFQQHHQQSTAWSLLSQQTRQTSTHGINTRCFSPRRI